MSAYYNEHDKFAAEWLRKLIAKNLIAPGEVDERDIQNVQPEELRGFTQRHFFAGIGVWSYALRAAGWSDDSPVWTGSCPCQGFSASGKRGGFSDQRHLWPAWFRLIAECRPHTIFGEQVASKDGLAWLDVVSADMEGAGYAIGTADLCAAGFGAPHIRQRLYFVADSGREQHRGWRGLRETAGAESNQGEEVRLRSSDDATDGGASGSVADAQAAERWRAGVARNRGRRITEAGGPSFIGDLGESAGDGRGEWRPESARIKGRLDVTEPSRTNGFWEAAEWIWCRDNKYRPVEPKYVALASGVAGAVGSSSHSGSEERAEEIDAAKINRDGEGCVRAVREERMQVARSPQGPEPGEQCRVEFADFVRLLPSSLALAQLSGDAITEKELLALLKASGAEGLVQHPSHKTEEVWRSLAKEVQDGFRVGVEAGGFVRVSEFPLAAGATNRVGRLRGYGNALNAEVAKGFIEAYMQVTEFPMIPVTSEVTT